MLDNRRQGSALATIQRDSIYNLKTPRNEKPAVTVQVGEAECIICSKNRLEIIGKAEDVLTIVKTMMAQGFRVTESGQAWDETVSPRKRVTFAKMTR